MEQVLTPDHELKRELLLRVTVERNNFLEICLKESESRLIRAKVWASYDYDVKSSGGLVILLYKIIFEKATVELSIDI